MSSDDGIITDTGHSFSGDTDVVDVLLYDSESISSARLIAENVHKNKALYGFQGLFDKSGK